MCGTVRSTLAMVRDAGRFSGPRAKTKEEMMLTYALRFHDRPDGLVSATFPDVPGAEAIGRDHDEAYERAQAALEYALDTCRREGRDFPSPKASGNLKITTVKFEMLVAA